MKLFVDSNIFQFGGVNLSYEVVTTEIDDLRVSLRVVVSLYETCPFELWKSTSE